MNDPAKGKAEQVTTHTPKKNKPREKPGLVLISRRYYNIHALLFL